MLEENLKLIKDAELDIEILNRENGKLCAKNNEEIAEIKERIKSTEFIIEEELKKSGKDKLECKLGSVSFKKMPDSWKYQDDILMSWIISLPTRLKNLFLKVTTTIRKGDLKKQLISDNSILFEKSKLIEDEEKIELFLVNEKRSYKVEGIEIEHQEPKFSYSIKKIK